MLRAARPPSPRNCLACRVKDTSKGWVELDRAVPFAAGGGSIHQWAPTVVDSGVERLTIEFK